MKKLLLIPMAIFLLSQHIYGACSNSNSLWQQKISQSRNIESFFLNNYECKKSFYRHLKSHQKLYYDTIVFPKGLKKSQYKNRWLAMSLNSDKAFFKTFPFFNNYFTKHKNSISKHELQCFQKQRGFPYPVQKKEFYSEIKKRGIQNDVSYLYPLIRWSHDAKGRDMTLSRERVSKAEKIFGIKKGKVGDKWQFARYLAIFDNDYEYVANHLAQQLNIKYIDAYKLLTIITFLESKGNLFATSTTGAFGPMQLTMHYYMMYGEPNNPFNPKSSLIKLANKFIYYHRIGKSLDASVVAYKSGSLEKCLDGRGKNSADCKYFYSYKSMMSEMVNRDTKIKVSRYLTGKAFFSEELKLLRRNYNNHIAKFYEPYQYAILKGNVLNTQARDSLFKSGKKFRSLGKMKRSDIYGLQDRYGINEIGVVSDKKVCY